MRRVMKVILTHEEITTDVMFRRGHLHCIGGRKNYFFDIVLMGRSRGTVTTNERTIPHEEPRLCNVIKNHSLLTNNKRDAPRSLPPRRRRPFISRHLVVVFNTSTTRCHRFPSPAAADPTFCFGNETTTTVVHQRS